GPMRRLHGADRWPARRLLPDTGGHQGRRERHNHRRAGKGRKASPAPAGLHRSRRLPVRLLHAGPDLLRGRIDGRRQGEEQSRDPRINERQYLPVRRLYEHRRGNPAGDGAVMIGFEYSRASNVADAVRQIAASPRAKFIAGGTNLVDLMKMEVERPTRLIDVS